MTAVVDDLLLIEVLGETPEAARAGLGADEIYTTGCWYYRVSRAMEAAAGGALSRRFEELDQPIRQIVRSSLEELPEQVGLLSWRNVVPTMARLVHTGQYNMLAAEALAVAYMVGGRILVRTHSPMLEAGAKRLDIAYNIAS